MYHPKDDHKTVHMFEHATCLLEPPAVPFSSGKKSNISKFK